MRSGRVVRWEDQFEALLASKSLTLASVQAALSGISGRRGLAAYLAERNQKAGRSVR